MTCATTLPLSSSKRGAPLHHVQQMLGHSNLKQTSTYVNAKQVDPVLTLHADRLFALLRKARVIDREDPGADRHHLPQALPQRPRLLRRVGDEMLQGPITGRVAEPPMHRLHGLPLAVVDEGVDVLTGRIALRVTIEAVGEPVRKLSEPLQERPNRPLCHERQRIRPLALVQVRSFEASRTRH